MARCQVVDVLFSYAYARIGRICLIESVAETAPKLPESARMRWPVLRFVRGGAANVIRSFSRK